MQSYEKILYNAEIFFLFSWLKNYKKDVFFRHLQLKEVLVTGAMGDMKMKEPLLNINPKNTPWGYEKFAV